MRKGWLSSAGWRIFRLSKPARAGASASKLPGGSPLNEGNLLRLTIELTFFLGVSSFLAFLVGAIIVYADLRHFRRVDLLNPGLTFLGFYVLYNFLIFLDPEAATMLGASDYAALGMWGLLGILLGTCVAYSFNRFGRVVSSPIVPPDRLLFSSLALTLFAGVLIILMYGRNVGLSELLSGDHYARNKAAGGVLSGAFYLLPLGAGFSIASLLKSRGLFRFWHLTLIIAGLGSLFYLSSSRGQIFQSFFLAMYVFHYNVRRISKKILLGGVSILLVLMAVLGIIRSRIDRSAAEIAEVMTGERIGQFFLLQNLEPYKCGVRAAELVADGPPDGFYLLGGSYLYFIPYLFPQKMALLPRPVKLEEWYANTYTPDIAEIGGGWGFYPLVEAYFNFGEIGCFFPFFLFSFVINRLHLRAMRAPSGSILRMMDCMLAGVLIESMRVSFAGFFKNYVFVFMLSGYLLLRFCVSRMRKKEIPAWGAEQSIKPEARECP